MLQTLVEIPKRKWSVLQAKRVVSIDEHLERKVSYVWDNSWKAEWRDGTTQKGWSWEGKFSTQPSEQKNGCVKWLLIFGGYKKSGMGRMGLGVQKSEFGQLSRSLIFRTFSLPFFTFSFLFLFLFWYVRELGFLLKGVGNDERFQVGTSHDQAVRV